MKFDYRPSENGIRIPRGIFPFILALLSFAALILGYRDLRDRVLILRAILFFSIAVIAGTSALIGNMISVRYPKTSPDFVARTYLLVGAVLVAIVGGSFVLAK